MIAVYMPLALAESLWHELQGRAENLDAYALSLVREGAGANAISMAASDHELYQAGADCLHDALEGEYSELDTIEPVSIDAHNLADALAAVVDRFAKLADLHIGLIERVGGSG
jgi:hypothetical protein